MRTFDTWTAFLLMLFGLVGLCGLFASYAPAIPLERAMARIAALDEVAGPGDAARTDRCLRIALGSVAPMVLDGIGPMPERVTEARRVVVDEERREAASIGYRTRLMLGVVTAIAAFLGAGIMALSRKATAQELRLPPP